MQALGREADHEARVCLTGGATAVLLGWRDTPIDADLRIVPESDRLYRALPALKESLELNIELASPADLLYRYPAIDPPSFRSAVEQAFASRGPSER
jgi:hypothetical protein